MRSVRRSLTSRAPVDPGLTFGPVGRGPCAQLDRNDWWRALHTPAGPATVHVIVDRRHAELHGEAWGPGAAWVVDRLDDVTGMHDAHDEFRSTHPLIAALQLRLRGLRVVRLGCVLDVAAVTVLEQRVTTLEARRAWNALVHRHGTPAPGPAALMLPPDAATWAALPDREWRRVGVELRRSSTVRRVGADASGLDRAAAAGPDALARRLHATRGIGPWTVATVLHTVAGDEDAVPVGDWHLPRHVGFALAKEPRADDARMLELLEPFRPYRGRVWRLIVAGTPAPARRAPRARIHDLMRAEARRAPV